MVPVVINERPKVVPYKIDWPIELELSSEETIRIELPLQSIPIYATEIGLTKNDEDEGLSFYVGNTNFKEEFELVIEDNKYYFNKTKNANAIIVLGRNKRMSLTEFFNEYPPTIKFVDQSTLEGNLLVKINASITTFNRQNILVWDWTGTDIRKESQGDSKEKDSIQYKVIDTLKKDPDYCIIFDDDDAGEVADVIAIREIEKSILFEFYHCKYAHGDGPGSRVSDLYEVCGQAEKCIIWMQDTRKIIDRMIKREHLRLRNSRPSRFELGDLKILKELKNKMRFYSSKAQIYIVQPGVDSGNISPNMDRLLCGSSSYLMETYSIPLKLICS